MNNPISDLGKEHGAVTLMLQILRSVASQKEKGEVISKSDMDHIFEFLRSFVDACHHGKEEYILFPELVGDTQNKKLIDELLEEHQKGRGLVGAMLNTDSSKGFKAVVEDYVDLLTKHIEKENSILFPIALKTLSSEKQDLIFEEFEELEKNVIGEGKHEMYHKWLDELQEKYL